MAKRRETLAKIECHLKGILLIPFLSKKAISAVNKNDNKVITPSHIIRGLPRIGK